MKEQRKLELQDDINVEEMPYSSYESDTEPKTGDGDVIIDSDKNKQPKKQGDPDEGEEKPHNQF